MKNIFELKNVEEVRPNVFVQKRDDGQYRVVYPLVYKGKWRMKNQFSIRNIITIAIILFVAWSYYHDTQFSRELLENPCKILPEIQEYCLYTDNANTENTFTIPNNFKEVPGEQQYG